MHNNLLVLIHLHMKDTMKTARMTTVYSNTSYATARRLDMDTNSVLGDSTPRML